jgi:glyoxylase-like metal-dependent hydrolase (beta-lactamase superfamily II)
MRFIERDWLSSNQVLFFDGTGEDARASLVDAGYVKHEAHTVSLMRAMLARPDAAPVPLVRVINTHLHSDHCGGNAALREAFGCRIEVPQAELQAVQAWDAQRLSFLATGQRCRRFQADGAVAPGDTLTLGGASWTAHAAPGHDPHSLIFHCPSQGLLISADVLWKNGFGVMFPELGGESAFAEQRAMLDLVESLEVRCVLPGHGPAFTDVQDAIDRSRSRLAAFAADPVRNARNALKVMIKYQLLDIEQCRVDELMHHFDDAIVLRQCAQGYALFARALQV